MLARQIWPLRGRHHARIKEGLLPKEETERERERERGKKVNYS